MNKHSCLLDCTWRSVSLLMCLLTSDLLPWRRLLMELHLSPSLVVGTLSMQKCFLCEILMDLVAWLYFLAWSQYAICKSSPERITQQALSRSAPRG